MANNQRMTDRQIDLIKCEVRLEQLLSQQAALKPVVKAARTAAADVTKSIAMMKQTINYLKGLR
jgi:hypothetical protein